MITRLAQALALGLLVAAAAQPATAHAQTAWLWHPDYGAEHGYVPATLGISSRVSSPRQELFGELPKSGMVGEVAVEQKVVSLGQMVPLPTFADGTQATESEIFWTVQLWQATFDAIGQLDRIGDASVTFAGRTFLRADIQWGNWLSPKDAQILVTVVAVRPHDNRRSNR